MFDCATAGSVYSGGMATTAVPVSSLPLGSSFTIRGVVYVVVSHTMRSGHAVRCHPAGIRGERLIRFPPDTPVYPTTL